MKGKWSVVAGVLVCVSLGVVQSASGVVYNNVPQGPSMPIPEIRYATPGIVLSRDGMTFVTRGDELVARYPDKVFNNKPAVSETYYSPTGIKAFRTKPEGGQWFTNGITPGKPWGLRNGFVEPPENTDWCSLLFTKKQGGAEKGWKIKPKDGDRSTGKNDCQRDKKIVAQVSAGKKPKGYTCKTSSARRKCRSTSNVVLAESTSRQEIREINSNRERRVKYCGTIGGSWAGGLSLLAPHSKPELCEQFTRETGMYIASVKGIYGFWPQAVGGWSCQEYAAYFECYRAPSSWQWWEEGDQETDCVAFLKPFTPQGDFDRAPLFFDGEYDDEGNTMFMYAQVPLCVVE